MLVEINLLPQKEPKKFNILYLSVIAAVLVVIGGLYYWQIQSVKSDVAAVENQIAMTKKIAEKQQNNANANEATMSANLLKTAVDWAKSYPIETIPVMRHLTSLLPERGFIQSFAYTEAGTVTLSVQFDSAREAAFFLENLKESKWIKDVSLSSLSAVEVKEAETTAQATTQTGTQNTNTTTTNTETQTTNNTRTTNANQTTTTGSNTTGTTSTQNTNTTAATTSSKTVKPDKSILPRYLGQFEITFNKEVIKTDSAKKSGEGGTGS